MKILQINSRVNKGSASRITEQIGQLVLANGWDSYIAYARPSGVSSSKLIRIGSSFDYKLHYLLSLIFDKEGLFSTRYTRNLLKKLSVSRQISFIYRIFMGIILTINYCLSI